MDVLAHPKIVKAITEVQIGQNIQKLMDEKGILQAELADRLFITQAQMSQIISAKRKCTLETAVLITQVLDCTLDDLVAS